MTILEDSSDPRSSIKTSSNPDPNANSGVKSTVQAPPTSLRQPLNPAPPTATTAATPNDPTTSFMRWSTASSLPLSSEPETGNSTWSFHPSEYDPDPAPLALAQIRNTDFAVGLGERLSESSFDTFGRGECSPKGVERARGDRAVDEGEVLPGTVLKFERGMRAQSGQNRQLATTSTSSTESSTPRASAPTVHFGQKMGTIEASPNAIIPSPRHHRSAASTSNLEAIYSPPKTHAPRTRTRSKSIDSISLNPSASDSVTALLLPSKLPLIRQNTLPEEMIARNDLDPEQRVIFRKRAEKLRQILGEALDERSIERLLIDPIHASRTITTRLEDQAWPDSPTGTIKSGNGREEWQKEDVVPRKGKAVEPTLHGGLARSRSLIVRTARAAFGLAGTGAGEKKNDLAVYISREIRVSETGVRGIGSKPRLIARHSISTPPGTMSLAAMLKETSPESPTREVEEDVDGSDAARRTRRLQLAKLHRLLGVPIPPDLVQRYSDSTDRSSTPTPSGRVRSPSPEPDSSFMVMDDTLITPTPSWSAMLKNTLGIRSRRSSSPGKVPTPSLLKGSLPRGESFVDMSTMNDREKAVARKKAQKLEYMFGDTPPQSMFLPQRPSTPFEGGDGGEGRVDSDGTPTNQNQNQNQNQSSTRNRTISHESFAAYQQSLTNLLYLADNDSATLDILMDQLDLDEPTSGLDTNSHEARRKRTGKLTHFFGETGIDFDDPPNVATTMERVRSRTATTSTTNNPVGAGGRGREMLDEMMREMWRVVQSEVKRGGMAVKDGERLGEMIDRLRFRRNGGIRLD